MMRWLVRALLICLAAVLFIGACVGFWFFIYSADLADFRALARYAPAHETRVSDPCLQSESIAIPYDAIGYNLHAALNAAEGHERTGQLVVRMQISRSMFCDPSRTLEREVKEWRAAEQLRWRFSQNQLLTIYANRVWFGDDCTGVEVAAQHYFHKEPNQLNIAEAALLAGLIQRPSYFLPLNIQTALWTGETK
jgi:membrane carboxypeptidase/penicillin-binding protein